MTTIGQEDNGGLATTPPSGTAASVAQAMQRVEDLMSGTTADKLADRAFRKQFTDALTGLHVLLRAQHGTARLGKDDAPVVRPEYAEDEQRLVDEHSLFVGNLDRIIRQTPSIAQQFSEDQAVFVLKIRELFAMIRRHAAEHNRLVYLSVWQDVGGESGS